MALTRSERTHLILEIGHRLTGNYRFRVIDIILRQFNFPTPSSWVGNESSYVGETIENGDDKTLLELGRHLGYEFDLSLLPDAVPSFWEDGHFRLFISHLAEHQKFASEIKAALFEFGVSSFVAHKDIEPAQEWQDVIESALATCDGMLALLHDRFHKSNWTDQEIGYGLGRKLLIVAVHLGTTPYGFIGKFQALLDQDASTLAKGLVEILQQDSRTRGRMVEAEAGLDIPPPVDDDIPPPVDDDIPPPADDDIPPPADDDIPPPADDDIPPPADDDITF